VVPVGAEACAVSRTKSISSTCVQHTRGTECQRTCQLTRSASDAEIALAHARRGIAKTSRVTRIGRIGDSCGTEAAARRAPLSSWTCRDRRARCIVRVTVVPAHHLVGIRVHGLAPSTLAVEADASAVTNNPTDGWACNGARGGEVRRVTLIAKEASPESVGVVGIARTRAIGDAAIAMSIARCVAWARTNASAVLTPRSIVAFTCAVATGAFVTNTTMTIGAREVTVLAIMPRDARCASTSEGIDGPVAVAGTNVLRGTVATSTSRQGTTGIDSNRTRVRAHGTDEAEGARA
jgi:hypothetical protein